MKSTILAIVLTMCTAHALQIPRPHDSLTFKVRYEVEYARRNGQDVNNILKKHAEKNKIYICRVCGEVLLVDTGHGISTLLFCDKCKANLVGNDATNDEIVNYIIADYRWNRDKYGKEEARKETEMKCMVYNCYPRFCTECGKLITIQRVDNFPHRACGKCMIDLLGYGSWELPDAYKREIEEDCEQLRITNEITGGRS